MSKLSFKYCPICGKELDTGRAKFPTPHAITEWIEAEGKYYSDKEDYHENTKNPFKRIFWTYDKLFTVQTLRAGNPAGYCKDCNRIFAEFEVEDI